MTIAHKSNRAQKHTYTQIVQETYHFVNVDIAFYYEQMKKIDHDFARFQKYLTSQTIDIS